MLTMECIPRLVENPRAEDFTIFRLKSHSSCLTSVSRRRNVDHTTLGQTAIIAAKAGNCQQKALFMEFYPTCELSRFCG